MVSDSHASNEGLIRKVHIAPGDAGARLDRALAGALPDLSRSRLQDLIAQGAVARRLPTTEEGTNNGETTIRDPNHRVKPGETYSVRVPPAAPAAPQPQSLPLAILFEDADLIVIDKPPGLVVHPAAGNLEGTLVNALLAHCTDLAGVGGVLRPGIVHRLDKDTSGLLVVAKNERAMRSLAKQFAARAIERAYDAVVWGVPRQRQGMIEGNLGRHPFDRKRMAVLRDAGKPARTRYAVQEIFGAADRPFAALLTCRLETGRTHQIRVHLAHIGHPLIGDRIYGRSRIAPRARNPAEETAYGAAMAFPRQALHARVLGFHHPTRHEKMRFEAPWPADLVALVRALRTANPGG